MEAVRRAIVPGATYHTVADAMGWTPEHTLAEIRRVLTALHV